MLKTKKRSVSFFRVNDSENERERGKRKREGRTACLERERDEGLRITSLTSSLMNVEGFIGDL